ncbi:MAG: acetyl-CoA carboxylase biotin carboxylase subunit [Candidatus Kapabacteria bacterium]|nr:acetyl-CoA carboxylase biotin carboxylase subunit [Candidatus Kapabacteria bacterium]
MFKKILIANRSEIACRIIRACKELDIKTVAVYSEADRNSLHVLMADEAICIGPPPALQSYLNMDAIINAALETNCDAIHPGYGFLSEKFVFNKKVNEVGLVFIGSSPEPMKLLGSKVESRKTMIEAGVPVIPGMKGSSKDISEYIKLADEIGYPVLIKASDGGGGKGMRVVYNPDDLKPSVESAMRESQSAFGSDIVFLEKYIESPRHVEIQIAADNYGNVVYLFERECSIQRRHQKIIEETPSVALTTELRKKMGETAVRVVKAANYNNLGTVEFLLDKDKNFYFLEVNTRIQVEHPVTEMTTGVDLVKLQIRIAAGEELPFKQEELSQNGHSIECRIYAEDADNNFMPSAGKILLFKEPVGPGIRYDSGVYQGSEVPIYYDPILAKLIVWGKNREEARKRMILALKDNVILGVQTSIRFMLDVLEHPEFIDGNTYTNFIEKNMRERSIFDDLSSIFAVAAYANLNEKPKQVFQISSDMPTPWQTIGKWEIANS